jgi:hypothetical protein
VQPALDFRLQTGRRCQQRCWKSPSAARNDALAAAGGLVAVLLNMPDKLRFRCSLLGRQLRFGLAALATASNPFGVFAAILPHLS